MLSNEINTGEEKINELEDSIKEIRQNLKQKLTVKKGNQTNLPLWYNMLTSLSQLVMQKFSKHMEEMSNTINKFDLLDIQRTLRPTTEKYTFFSSTHKTFIKGAYLLNSNTDFSNSKRLIPHKPFFLTAMQVDRNHKQKITL